MQNIIKILRTRKGMTQEELGAYLGVKKSAIQKYESGAIVNLKAETIRKLSELFEVPPAFFIYPSEEVLAVNHSEASFMATSEKWSSSAEYRKILGECIFLNDLALSKVNDYIGDLLKIKEYRSNE